MFLKAQDSSYQEQRKVFSASHQGGKKIELRNPFAGSLKPSSCRLATWVVGWVGRVSMSGRRVEYGAEGRRVGVGLNSGSRRGI